MKKIIGLTLSMLLFAMMATAQTTETANTISVDGKKSCVPTKECAAKMGMTLEQCKAVCAKNASMTNAECKAKCKKGGAESSDTAVKVAAASVSSDVADTEEAENTISLSKKDAKNCSKSCKKSCKKKG